MFRAGRGGQSREASIKMPESLSQSESGGSDGGKTSHGTRRVWHSRSSRAEKISISSPRLSAKRVSLQVYAHIRPSALLSGSRLFAGSSPLACVKTPTCASPKAGSPKSRRRLLPRTPHPQVAHRAGNACIDGIGSAGSTADHCRVSPLTLAATNVL